MDSHETRMNIIAGFKVAGLPVSTSISRNPSAMLGSPVPIVRLSINQGSQEYFMVDVGDEKNKVEVLAIDENFKQLVLLVKEPKREYKVPRKTQKYEVAYKSTKDVKIEYEIRHTDPTERRYLMGLDEKHLFISGLPKENVNTVKEAHQCLKHAEVIKAEKEGIKVKRQGEYFFIPLTEKEEKEFMVKVDEWKKRKGKNVLRNASLRRRGHRPHFVKRFITMRRGTKRYAQGYVSHEQHIPLHLPGWHRIYKNRETESPGISGFID